jgi:hypothetical protein
MALGTVTVVTRYKNANKRVTVADIQLSTGANWTAAGESLTPAMVGMRKIEEGVPLGLASNGTLTFQVTYDHTNNKLIASGQNATPGPAVGQPAVTGNTNLSAYTVRMKFSGF